MSWKVSCIEVRDRHEWATFFVRESPVVAREGGGFNASAEWTCNSSFGVFGHYWSSMGEPFGEFIRGVDTDYLLGKICSGRVTNERDTLKTIRAKIIERRRSKQIDADVAREAIESLDGLKTEYSGEVLYHQIYCDSAIHEAGIDLCECSSMEWPAQAREFAKRLWPKFVEAFNKQAVAA